MTAKRDDSEERAIDFLLATAAAKTGLHVEGVAREAVRRALRRELATGVTMASVLKRAADGDGALVRTLRSAVAVRETFFFRHPEQFTAIAARAHELAPGGTLRAWSAGCATGEETWSLAATLFAGVGHTGAPISVVGSDIDDHALEIARSGQYRTSSLRPSGPVLYSTFATSGAQLDVLPVLRAFTSFAMHDLRDPPLGEFELIMTRNVLIYFEREVARKMLANLAGALAPGGLLVVGPMDIDATDLRGLQRVGKPELMMFTQRGASRRRPTTRKQPVRAKSTSMPPDAVALHRSALLWIEAGARDSAENLLIELNRRFPDYLPGILERALVHVRKGDRTLGIHWMREVLKRAEALEPEGIVPGLDPLPVAFYRDTARSYLDRNALETRT